MTEMDLRAIGTALTRRSGTIVFVTLLALVGIVAFVTLVTPRYTAETQLLLENQETFFTRPDRVNLQPDFASQLDPEAVASQVQLIGSRDIARRAIKELGLEGDSEFDADSDSPLKRLLVLVGLASDPSRDTVDNRIVTKFLDKLTVYSPPKTRVISIQFTSRDPDLAARAANTIAALYLKEQSAAKRTTAKESADALGSQIADLRAKLMVADSAREEYRQQSGLLAGTNNMTISGQQLADINTDLSKARTSQADAQAKASLIRELLRSGKAADVPDVLNNDIVRRVSDQRVSAEAQLALEARTLLPGHPRIKALTAQLDEYDLALKNAAKQAATTLENEAKIAGTRVVNLEAVLAQQKRVAGVANVDEVHLHELERAAQSLKDQLESSNTKYQEALARQSSTATPADARVISRAVTPQDPSFPKKLPFIAFGTIAALVFTVGFIVTGELLSGRATYEVIDPARHDERLNPTAPIEQPSRQVATAVVMPVVDEPEDLVFAPVASSPSRLLRAGLLHRLETLAAGTALGSLISRVRAFGQSAAESRTDAVTAPREPDSVGFGWGDEMPVTNAERPAAGESLVPGVDFDNLATRIVGTHVPGRGLHIIAASLGPEAAANDILIRLSRTLADRGRSVVVDLNRSPTKLVDLARQEGEGRSRITTLNGLSELLAGDASFADVIHRDHASRLHFIPTGRQEADFRDFDLILDALSETYDFIVMLTPAFPNGEIAKIMAPYADFVVLATVTEPDRKKLAMLETELIEAGAREVLVAGATVVGRVRDVA